MAQYGSSSSSNSGSKYGSAAAAKGPVGQATGGEAKARKTHSLVAKSKGATRDDKPTRITGFFQDDGKSYSSITVTDKILEVLGSLKVGDKFMLFTETESK